MNMVIAHPKLVTFGIGLAITFVIGLAIGMLDHDALARKSISQSNSNDQD